LFVFGPASRVVHEELFGQFDVPDAGCWRFEEGGVAANGIPLQRDTAFTAPCLLHPRHVVVTTIGRMAERLLPRRHIDGMLAVIYGPGYQTHGHWLVDFLPRLWLLFATGHDMQALSFVVPPDLSPVARELLRLVGIAPRQLVTHDYLHEQLTADVVLAPTGLRLGNRISRVFREATLFWTGRLRANTMTQPPGGARIFLSRGRIAQQRMMVNREAVEAIAVERGFTLVSPETLTLGAQAALFSGACLLAGEYGSALHGSVFSGRHAVTLGLRGNSRHPSFIQSGLGAALGQHTGYLLGDTTHQDVEQRFAVDLADFERALDIIEAQATRNGAAFA
jgi:capsular polysaccharide biosynthesis protein